MNRSIASVVLLRLAATISILMLAATGFADPPGSPPGKALRYIVVLKAGTAEGDEPDVAKHGGRARERWKNRRVVEIPLAALDALRKHPNVAFLALVNDGTETDAPKYVLGDHPSSSSVRSDAVVTPPTWDSGVYQYDGSGNIKKIGADDYNYDLAQRLTSASVNGESLLYKYDSFGNLIERTIGSTTVPASTNIRTNQLNYVRYDRTGNQLSTPGDTEEFRYDAANMMVDRTHLTQRRYIYTADDERIGVRVGENEWYWSFRDFSGRVLARFQTNSTDEWGDWYWDEGYHYRDGVLSSGLLPEELTVGGIEAGRYFHLDHLGTPRLMTNHDALKIAAHDYHPFGREQTPFNQEMTEWLYNSIEPMQFTGHERDYTASMDSNSHNYLDYMHARYYNPSVGRFLSVDPAMDIKKNLVEPQRWNRYAYVTNNPIRYTDPDGRDRYQEPGLTKPLSEAGGWAEQPSVSWAFQSQGFLLSLATPGPEDLLLAPLAKQLGMEMRIFNAVNDAAPGHQLEGTVARYLGGAVTKFQEVVFKAGKRFTDVDVGTSKALIQVTTKTNGHLKEAMKLLDPVVNPTGKPVYMFAPNYTAGAAKAAEKAGIIVVRTLEALEKLVR